MLRDLLREDSAVPVVRARAAKHPKQVFVEDRGHTEVFGLQQGSGVEIALEGLLCSKTEGTLIFLACSRGVM